MISRCKIMKVQKLNFKDKKYVFLWGKINKREMTRMIIIVRRVFEKEILKLKINKNI